MFLCTSLLFSCAKNNQLKVDKIVEGKRESNIDGIMGSTATPCKDMFIKYGVGTIPTAIKIEGVAYKIPDSLFDLSKITPNSYGEYKVFSNCNMAPSTPMKLHSDSLVLKLSHTLMQIMTSPPATPVPRYSHSAYVSALASTPYTGDGLSFVSSVFNSVIAVNPKVPKLPTENVTMAGALIAISPYFEEVNLNTAVNFTHRAEAVVIAVHLKIGASDPFNVWDESKITFIDPQYFIADGLTGDLTLAGHVFSDEGSVTMKYFFQGDRGVDQTRKVRFFMFRENPRSL